MEFATTPTKDEDSSVFPFGFGKKRSKNEDIPSNSPLVWFGISITTAER